MKKLILLALLFCSVPVMAEMYKPHRVFEFGTNVDFEFSQNFLSIDKIFKKQIVLDFTKIYDGMGNDGFIMTAGVAPEVYFDVNFRSYGFGFHAATEASGRLNISKDFFSIFANGYTAGTEEVSKFDFWFQSFASVSVPVRFKAGDLRIKLTPSYFMPLVYIPKTQARTSFTNTLDGRLLASAVANVDIYTVDEFKGLIGKDGRFSSDVGRDLDAQSLFSKLMQSGGIDLTASVEYPLFFFLDLAAYTSVPIVPARLKHKVSSVFTATIETPPIIDMMFDVNREVTKDYDYTDPVYSSANYLVNRPFRLGAEAAFRPFGIFSWLTVRGRLGLAARNPFGEDFDTDSFYPEYRISAEAWAFSMLGVKLTTEYTDKVFAHALSLGFNFRVFELDTRVAFSSASFVKSFQYEGLRGAIGVKFGY